MKSADFLIVWLCSTLSHSNNLIEEQFDIWTVIFTFWNLPKQTLWHPCNLAISAANHDLAVYHGNYQPINHITDQLYHLYLKSSYGNILGCDMR